MLSLISEQRQSRNAPGGIEEVLKPRMVEEYNKHMGGVDKADQLLSYYGFCHRTVKWWRQVFIHLLDLSVVNAYILYRENNTQCSRVTHEQFRIQLGSEMLMKSGLQSHNTHQRLSLLPPACLTERHFLEKVPLRPSGRPAQLHCHVCCWKKGRQRVTTTYQCKQCKLPLCAVPCHELYHTFLDPQRQLAQV